MTGLFRFYVFVFLAVAISAPVLATPSDDHIAKLIEQLGDPQYGRREQAAAKLDDLGVAAIDQLLAAAEMSDDLEVALRAGWLADSIPVDDPTDSSEAQKLLKDYKSKPLAKRVLLMHWLLRLDHDTGITPLARIARLDRDLTASRVATALLVREWTPNNPYWQDLTEHITTGLGRSQRPTSQLLMQVLSYSRADSSNDRQKALEQSKTFIDLLDRARPSDETASVTQDTEDGESSAAITRDLGQTTQRIFERCLVLMLIDAGKPTEARDIVKQSFRDFLSTEDSPLQSASNLADTMIWAAAHGLPDVVDDIPTNADQAILNNSIFRFAQAICERTRNNEQKAEQLARTAFDDQDMDFVDRLRAGILLAKWGAGDWATREYTAVVDDDESPPQQQVLASVMYAEFLHDRGRDGEAAGVLERCVGEDAGPRQPALEQIGRDPALTKSRANYFRACAAREAGDKETERRLLEQASSKNAPDVDALIALYKLHNTPAEKEAALKRIRSALARMEEDIKQIPEDPNPYNEYAWLVSNTEGDISKALRYSKISLRKSFDSASYLDTLAHCYAAAGDYPEAIRTQTLAMRHEPHSQLIQKNLRAFEQLAASQQNEK